MTEQRKTEVRTTQHEPGSEQRLHTFKAMKLIWLGLGVIEVILGLRFLFKLIAVNPGNSVVSLLYRITDLFLFPFAGLIGTPASGGMSLEISTLIAMIVYALLAWGLVKLVEIIFYRPRAASVNVTESTSSEQHTNNQ